MILLDTHVLGLDGFRLKPTVSRSAARELRKARRAGSLAIASITLWELALLCHQGRLRTSAVLNPPFGRSSKNRECRSSR